MKKEFCDLCGKEVDYLISGRYPGQSNNFCLPRINEDEAHITRIYGSNYALCSDCAEKIYDLMLKLKKQ